jgi:hypothetical protein
MNECDTRKVITRLQLKKCDGKSAFMREVGFNRKILKCHLKNGERHVHWIQQVQNRNR